MPATVAPARTCAACTKPLEGGRRTRRYCDDSCRAWHRRHPDEERAERTCTVCSTTLPINARPDRRYCSVSCQMWDYRHPSQKRDARACERCGKALPPASRVDRRWCSQQCRAGRRLDPHREQLERVSKPPDDQAIDDDLIPWLMRDVGGNLAPLGRPPSWWRQAACSGMATDLFVGDQDRTRAAAVAVCQACPARRACLEYALHDPELYTHGVFGGATPAERRAMGRARGLDTSPRHQQDDPAPAERGAA